MTTLEPFGPARPEELAAAEKVEKKAEVVDTIAVVDVHDDEAPCTQEEIASGACDDDEGDGSDLEEVPAEDLAKKSALRSIVSAMKNVGEIFRGRFAHQIGNALFERSIDDHANCTIFWIVRGNIEHGAPEIRIASTPEAVE